LRERLGETPILNYWQPLPGLDHAARLASLEAILPNLAHLHVFHWAPDQTRLPLAEGRDDWSAYLKAANRPDRERFCLLEFVKGDAPAQFRQDAQTLCAWLEEANG
jgi:3-dehydroshikimate dehydratase